MFPQHLTLPRCIDTESKWNTLVKLLVDSNDALLFTSEVISLRHNIPDPDVFWQVVVELALEVDSGRLHRTHCLQNLLFSIAADLPIPGMDTE